MSLWSHEICSSLGSVRFGRVLLLNILINLWFFIVFLCQSQVVLCTYVLLQGAFVGQCSKNHDMGLLIENWRKAQLWKDQFVVFIFLWNLVKHTLLLAFPKFPNLWGHSNFQILIFLGFWYSQRAITMVVLGTRFPKICNRSYVMVVVRRQYFMHCINFIKKTQNASCRQNIWGLASSDDVSNSCALAVGGWLTHVIIQCGVAYKEVNVQRHGQRTVFHKWASATKLQTLSIFLLEVGKFARVVVLEIEDKCNYRDTKLQI